MTGVEPGGIVVVRFAGDGSERKLMADYAPITQTVRCPALMAAQIIDGKAVAARVRAEVAEEVAAFTAEHGRAPGLATILVGDDPASAVYVGGKQKASAEVGIAGFDAHARAATRREDEVAALIERAQRRRRASAASSASCRCPTTSTASALTGLIDADKDVDGLTPQSAPACSRSAARGCARARRSACMMLLEAAGVAARGRRGRRDRALEPLRQADGAAAARAPTRR